METKIGVVTHYYSKISVAVLELTGELHVGDIIAITGHTTDLIQRASSIEIEHHKIEYACPGMEVALKVADVVRRGDGVYKIPEKEASPDLRILWEKEEIRNY